MNDKKSELSAGTKFHEDIAAGWAQGYTRASFDRRRICFRSLLDRNVVAGEAWLDLGCGAGVLTRELLERHATVLAVDGSPAMLKEAHAGTSGDQGLMVTWLQSDVRFLPQVRDASFDGVVCSSVLEYLETPEAALREAARLLRPGGKLIVSMPPKFSAVRIAQKTVRSTFRLFGAKMFPYLGVSVFEANPGRLREWLSDAGFSLDKVTEFDPFLPRWALALLRPALLIAEAHKNKTV